MPRAMGNMVAEETTPPFAKGITLPPQKALPLAEGSADTCTAPGL